MPERQDVENNAAELVSQTLWNDVLYVYDTMEDLWYRLENPLPPGGRFNDAGVCIIGDTIYVAGAEGPSGGHYDHFLIGRIRGGNEKAFQDSQGEALDEP